MHSLEDLYEGTPRVNILDCQFVRIYLLIIKKHSENFVKIVWYILLSCNKEMQSLALIALYVSGKRSRQKKDSFYFVELGNK